MLNTIYDPTTQTIAYDAKGNPYPVRQSFASEYPALGNAIPSTLFDQVAAKFQHFIRRRRTIFPEAQFVAPTGSYNSEGMPLRTTSTPASSNPRRTESFSAGLDYDITPNNRLTMSDTQSDTPQMYPSTVTVCPVGCQTGDVDNNNAQITDVWNISPHHHQRGQNGFHRSVELLCGPCPEPGYASQLGWQFAKADDFPAIQVHRMARILTPGSIPAPTRCTRSSPGILPTS